MKCIDVHFMRFCHFVSFFMDFSSDFERFLCVFCTGIHIEFESCEPLGSRDYHSIPAGCFFVRKIIYSGGRI